MIQKWMAVRCTIEELLKAGVGVISHSKIQVVRPLPKIEFDVGNGDSRTIKLRHGKWEGEKLVLSVSIEEPIKTVKIRF
jgi:hypothetical protein